MPRWKSSTVLVASAFGLSVVLLFAKAGMMRERAVADRPLITNHVYSPAAADPGLRNQRTAERYLDREPKATRTSSRSVVVRQPNETSKRSTSFTPKPVATGATGTSATRINKPFYVVAGTFRSEENAARMLSELKAKGLSHSFLGEFNDGKLVSVIVRRFDREDQARVMLAELKAKHKIDGIIYHKTEE